MSPRSLVTGATGFLGHHLCAELCRRGTDVGATRRESSAVDRVADLPIEWHRADVLDPDAVRSAIEGYDRVYHLAGVGLQSADAATVRRVNREGTRHVLESAHETGVERVVFTSTAGTRRSASVADETDLATPIGAYQAGKASAERIADRYARAGLDVVTTHPTSVFGPGDTTFTSRLFDLVTDRKAVVHPPGGASIVGVDSVVSGLVAAMERGRAGDHYILGGQNLTYHDALSVIAAAVDGHAPPVELPAALIHAAGPVVGVLNRRLDRRVFPFNRRMARLATRTHFYSSEKASAELGYEHAPLQERVEDAWDWYRQASCR
jgi:dihydroflavonol-4-reductase